MGDAGGLHPGARVLVGGRHRATLRYLGELDGQQGEWAGLEWDDAARGKHDGVAGGRRYFATRGGAPSASFVRLPKLLESADGGCSLLEALRERYGVPGGSGGVGRWSEEGVAARAGSHPTPPSLARFPQPRPACTTE